MKDAMSLSMNVRGMGQSPTIAIKDRCREMRRAGREVYDFGLGESPFPVPSSVVEALRSAAPRKSYLPSQGLPELREAVANFHNRKEQLEVRPEGVLVGPGSKELMFLLQLVFYGELVVRSPCWVSYLPQARILGRRIHLINTNYEDGWKLTPTNLLESLERTNDDSRPRVLIMNYPMNPTGHTYSVAQLKELAEVARKFQLIVLSDEIYGQLHYQGGHVSIARFYPERTIIASGLSKWCGAGGWRLGTFAFPPELDWLLEAMTAVASETYTSVSAPIQYAAITAFQCGPEIESYLRHARRVLQSIASCIVPEIQNVGIRVHPPLGAYYLFPDFSRHAKEFSQRGIHSAETLCERLIDEKGVAILPGSAFTRPRSELTARLSFVDFDGAAALAASEKIPLDEPLGPSFVDEYCPRVIGGVRRMAEWVKTASGVNQSPVYA